MWHAQGAYTAASFLPHECPLVDHLITSYDKYHIKNRVEEAKEIERYYVKPNLQASKLMFQKRKNSKVSVSRKESNLSKSKSYKIFDLYNDNSLDLLPKKLQL